MSSSDGSSYDTRHILAREIEPVRGGFTWGLGLASIIIVSIVVLLRAWSRLLNQSQRFGPDDWLAFIAWPIAFATALAIMFAFRWGIGTHAALLTDQEFTTVNKLQLVILLFYCTEIVLIRVSASFYYRRIFAASTIFCRAVWINVAVNIAWGVAIIFGTVFQCRVPAAMWNKDLSGIRCQPPIQHQRICAFSSFFLDLIVLLLPLPMIWRLQVKTTKKWEVFAIFIFGYLVPILTLGRLISTEMTGDKLNEDPTWYFPNILYWQLLEMTAAFVGLCMPAILFLVRRWQASGFHTMFHRRVVARSNRASLEKPQFVLGYSSVAVKRTDSIRSDSDASSQQSLDFKHLQGRLSPMAILQTRTYTVTTESGSLDEVV